MVLPQALLEGVDILHGLGAVDGQATLIETYVAVAARAIRVILDAARVNDRRGWVIPALLNEACHGKRRSRLICFKESSIVTTNEGIPTSTICEIMDSKGIRFDLCSADSTSVISSKYVRLRHTIS